jgi:hypothetical protein
MTVPPPPGPEQPQFVVGPALHLSGLHPISANSEHVGIDGESKSEC